MAIIKEATVEVPIIGPGTRVGSYLIEGRIADGGMGAVYRAVHAFIGRRAALKIMHLEMADNDVAKCRMMDEARILASMSHPTMAQVYDAGLLADGRPWMAMELFDGETLSDLVERTGRLPVDEVARILVGVVDVLALAHARGVVHRDVKPENIMIVDGQVRLIDWGIAKAPSLKRLTQHDTTAGTPSFMAPEQLLGLPDDGRIDIYALGVVAFELCAGRLPFVGETAIEVALQHLHTPAPHLPPELPVELDGLIGAMLAKDPADRPTLAALRAQLVELRDEPQISLEVNLELDDDRPEDDDDDALDDLEIDVVYNDVIARGMCEMSHLTHPPHSAKRCDTPISPNPATH